MATMTETYVLRLRSFLPNTSESLACGMCFPYACNCTVQSTTRGRSRQVRPVQQQTPTEVADTSSTDDLSSPSATSAHPSDVVRPRARSYFLSSSPTTTSIPSPKKSFLQPFNLDSLKKYGAWTTPKPTTAYGRQTNIEVEKEKYRLATAAAAAATASSQLSTSSLCTRCHSALPSSAHTTVASNALNTCRSCHIYTGAELSTHSTVGDLWVSLSGGAYNLTAFAKSHPGGLLPILDVAGCDATDVFKVFHSAEIQAKLPLFQVGLMGEFDSNGRLIDGVWGETPMQKDFHDMIAQLEKDGQFETSYAWYWMKVAVLVTMFASVVSLVLFSQHWLGYVASALILGMFWQQLAFMGHDLGHNSVRGSAAKDWLGGLIVTAFFGVSVQWWKRNHNVHHVVTNSYDHDPDIQHLPVFCVSSKAFSGYYSSYFEKTFKFDAISRFLVSHQHNLYYPVMGVARVNLYIQSILLLLDRSKSVAHRTYEWGALFTFYIWYALLTLALPDNTTRFWYFLLSHSMAGLVHVQITLSHFSMPVYEGRGYSSVATSAEREHFLRCQFETSMDIDCPEWLDWLHGGLQFQVAHHLIPRAPRHRLRHIREAYIKPFAKRHGITYHEETFPQANKTVYNALKGAAYEARVMPNAPKFTQSYLWQFMQMDG